MALFGRRKKGRPAPSERPEGRDTQSLQGDGSTESDATHPGWRLLYNPDGDAADIVAYATGLAEGRIAGKYMLSNERLPDTVVVQGVTGKGMVAGADLRIDQEAAQQEGITVAKQARSGRSGAAPVDTINLAELMVRSSDRFKAREVDLEQPAVLLYTSGTTGKPKGVMLTHRNFHSQCAEVVPTIFEMTKDDRVVLVLPLFHVYGLSNGLVAGLFNASTMILVSHYSPRNLLDAISENHATILIAIPTMYQHLLQFARVRNTSIPTSLHTCVSGGAPLPVTTIREFEELFQTRINEGYGLTETTSAVSLNPSGDAYKEGSIGPPAGPVEMAIMDDDGTILGDGEVGEIVISAAVVTPGYWKNEEATGEAIVEGWFHTGDLGYRDTDGYYFITDRKKDLIIRGGFNISPREVEETIMTHPAVEEAAIVAVTDKRDREAVKAFVVLKPGETIETSAITEYCHANLAAYKVPKLVEFVESLPKSATGKILRRELTGEATDDRLIERSSDVADAQGDAS